MDNQAGPQYTRALLLHLHASPLSVLKPGALLPLSQWYGEYESPPPHARPHDAAGKARRTREFSHVHDDEEAAMGDFKLPTTRRTRLNRDHAEETPSTFQSDSYRPNYKDDRSNFRRGEADSYRPNARRERDPRREADSYRPAGKRGTAAEDGKTDYKPRLDRDDGQWATKRRQPAAAPKDNRPAWMDDSHDTPSSATKETSPAWAHFKASDDDALEPSQPSPEHVARAAPVDKIQAFKVEMRERERKEREAAEAQVKATMAATAAERQARPGENKPSAAQTEEPTAPKAAAPQPTEDAHSVFGLGPSSQSAPSGAGPRGGSRFAKYFKPDAESPPAQPASIPPPIPSQPQNGLSALFGGSNQKPGVPSADVDSMQRVMQMLQMSSQPPPLLQNLPARAPNPSAVHRAPSPNPPTAHRPPQYNSSAQPLPPHLPQPQQRPPSQKPNTFPPGLNPQPHQMYPPPRPSSYNARPASADFGNIPPHSLPGLAGPSGSYYRSTPFQSPSPPLFNNKQTPGFPPPGMPPQHAPPPGQPPFYQQSPFGGPPPHMRGPPPQHLPLPGAPVHASGQELMALLNAHYAPR